MKLGIPDLITLPGHSTKGIVTIEYAISILSSLSVCVVGELESLILERASVLRIHTKRRSNRIAPKNGNRAPKCKNQLTINNK